ARAVGCGLRRGSMRRAAITLLAALALAGCGGSGNSAGHHNDEAVAQAQAEDSSVETIHTTLQSSLGLHDDYGVHDIYTTLAGDCGIDHVLPSDEAYVFDKDSVLTSPDGKWSVVVSTWFDHTKGETGVRTQLGPCLVDAREALGW